MHVAVLGAGAVGCFYGGLLARAGHDVVFIGRPSHVDAINTNGLLFETPQSRECVAARAAVDPHAIGTPDLILVAVKSAQTEEIGEALHGHLRSDTLVLSLQNGIDNAERLSRIIAQPVIPTVVYVGSEMAGPGHILQRGGGGLAVGRSAETERLQPVLKAAGIDFSVIDDIDARRWVKLAINCAYNAVSAIAELPYGPMMQVEGIEGLITEVVQEVVAVAGASDIVLPDGIIDDVLKLAWGMPKQRSSTAQDLERGKRSEIEFLNGYVVRKGAELGVPTPVNNTLRVMIKLREAKLGLS